MSSEDFKSFIVTNPDLVDEGIDVSGLRTTTDTSPFLLGNIPDSPGIQYDYLGPTKYSDLMRLYSQGLPMFDTPQAAAPVTTAPDTGDGGQATTPIDTIQPIDTIPGQPIDPTDMLQQIPVSQPMTGGITGDPIEIGIPDNESGYIDPLITQAGAPVVSQQLQDQGPTTIEGPLSQVQVPGLDYSQADIDAERLANYKNLPQEQQDPGFWETARDNFIKTGQDVGNFFKDLGGQGLDVTKLAGTTLLNLAGRALTGVPLLGTALNLIGGAESASGAQQKLVSDQFEEEGVTLDDIGRIQQVGLDYDTPENVMARYSPGETGIRIGDISVGGGTIQESIVDRLSTLEKTKNEKYNGSFYDTNGNPKLNPDTGQPTTLGAREEALKENLNTVARAAGAVTLDGPQYTQQPTLERAQELFPDDKERQNLFMELNKGYAPFSDTKTAGITLGPGEAGFLDDTSDLVTKEEQDAINLQEAVDTGIQTADDDSGSEMLDTPDKSLVDQVDTPQDDIFGFKDLDDQVVYSDYQDIGETPDSYNYPDRKQLVNSGTITPLEDDFESLVDQVDTPKQVESTTMSDISLAEMPMQEFENLINNVDDFSKSIDLVESRTRGQEYLDDLEEIGKGDAYIDYTEQEKADIAAGRKEPQLGELVDFAIDTTIGPSDQDIIDRGGGDDIGTGGLDPDRGQQVDRGSSGAGDNQPVSTTTGPPSTGFQPQSTYDAELEDDRDTGGGGNTGNNSKIVCTMMNDSYGFGSFRNKIWLKHSKGLAPEYQKGYHKIFLPLVKLSKTNKIVRKTLEHIAVHRTIDIRQESRGKVHLLGRVYRKILEPICYIVGKYAK